MEACQKSLKNEPIILHLVDDVPGHAGRARANGFRIGGAPYVSCVDPDDLVMPGAFQACIEVLENNPLACGAYTNEVVINAEGKPVEPGLWSGRTWNPLLQLEPKYLHHVFVMRRDFVLPHLDELENKWPHLAEYVLKGLLCLNLDAPPPHLDNRRVCTFLRTLESYRKSVGKNGELVLTTNSDFYRYLQKSRWAIRLVYILDKQKRGSDFTAPLLFG